MPLSTAHAMRQEPRRHTFSPLIGRSRHLLSVVLLSPAMSSFHQKLSGFRFTQTALKCKQREGIVLERLFFMGISISAGGTVYKESGTREIRARRDRHGSLCTGLRFAFLLN